MRTAIACHGTSCRQFSSAVTFVFACLAIELFPTQMTIWALIVALLIALVGPFTRICVRSILTPHGRYTSSQLVRVLDIYLYIP